MNIHSYRLHPLKGIQKGEWSVTVKANWRITFRFEEGYALEVNLEGYHRINVKAYATDAIYV